MEQFAALLDLTEVSIALMGQRTDYLAMENVYGVQMEQISESPGQEDLCPVQTEQASESPGQGDLYMGLMARIVEHRGVAGSPDVTSA